MLFAMPIPIILAIFGILSQNSVFALTYSTDVNVQFTFNPALQIDLSSADLLISNLSPGTAADSNVIDVIVKTNNITGYTLNATVGNNTTYDTRDLVHEVSGSSANFASINYGSSLASLTTDNTWGYSYSTDGGTNWEDYDGLPLYSDATNIATLKDSTTPPATSTGDVVNFKIAAKASTMQASGDYNNVINFIATANPIPTLGPVACESGKICYNANVLDSIEVEGTMGKPTANANTTTMLLASNFSRDGYGFAGWSDTYDYSGNLYGPQEEITTPADMSSGLPLYAIWVQSAGSMQTSDATSACNSLTAATPGFKSLASVTALTDERDGETYAIAKLADGNCWMIENLRLDNTADHNSDGTLAQGYNSSFAGLASPEAPSLFANATTANTLYSIDGSTDKTISGSDQGYRFPRYNNVNTPTAVADRPSNPTTNSATNSTSNAGLYSYGNYYTWSAAIADTTHYPTNNQSVTSTSICPTGWRLPKGGNKSNEANNDYWALVVTGINGGINPSNYDSETRPYYTSSPEGPSISNALRAYPNNIIYSGYAEGGSVENRGSGGGHWSSTAVSTTNAYSIVFYSNYVYTGTGSNSKYFGRTIRCFAPGT